GTAYNLLYACAGQGGHAFGHSGVIKGGMGALTQAIAQAAQSYGTEIRTDAAVAEVQVEHGRATGVTLAGGETLSAACVISNADPQTTFFKLVDPIHLDPFFMRQVNNIKYRGSAARVHLALAELPHFSALNGANGGDQSAYLRG